MIRQVDGHALFVGGAQSARDLRRLYDRGIAAVVDLTAEEPLPRIGDVLGMSATTGRASESRQI